MKFSLLAKGRRAERAASFPYLNDQGLLVDIPFIAIPLSVAEEADVAAYAEEYARRKGIKDVTPAHPLYSIGAQLKTIELSTRDPDSPAGSRTKLFDSPDEIETRLERETLSFLYAIVDDWQAECSPSIRKLTDAQFVDGIEKLGSGGADADSFLDRLGPAMRRIFTLSMARQLLSLRADKSGSSSTTNTSGQSA